MFKYKKSRQVLVTAIVLGLMSAQTAFAAAVEINLDKAIEMALKTNPTVKISEAESSVAKAQKDEAKASRWVSIDYSHSSSRGGYYDPNPLLSSQSGPDNTFSNGFTASIPLYTGGKLSDDIMGSVITYNNLTDVFTVDGEKRSNLPSSAPAGSGGRVRAILAPKATPGSSPAPAPAQPLQPSGGLISQGQ